MRLLCLVLVAGLLAVTFAQDPERPFEFPIGGESIVMGELITIKWDPDWRDDKVLLFTATKVLLNLFITGTPGGEPTLKIPITEDPTPNNGSYTWTTSADYLASDDYQIMIDNYRQNSAVYSDTFSLVKTSNDTNTASQAPNLTASAISSFSSAPTNTPPISSSISGVSSNSALPATAEPSTTVTTSSSTPTNTSPGPKSYTGLPTGAKAGIGVGVIALVLTIFAVAFLLWQRQRKRWAQAQVEFSNGTEHDRPEPTDGEPTSNIDVSALPELINIQNRSHNNGSPSRQMTNAGSDELNRLEGERRRILEAIAHEQNLERLRNEQRAIESRIQTVRGN